MVDETEELAETPGGEPESAEEAAELDEQEAGIAAEPAEDEAWEESSGEVSTEEASLAEMGMADGDDGGESVEVVEEGAGNDEPAEGSGNLDLLMDVTLTITVELGRRDMRFGNVLDLGKGSLVELNKVADEPVDIYVNQSKIAEGEVVVVDDHFGVRITRILSSERLRRLS